MRRAAPVVAVVAALAAAVPATAIHSGTDLLLPAVGSGPGYGDAEWRTEVTVLNPGSLSTSVELHWLQRDAANPQPPSSLFAVGPGQLLVLSDVPAEPFGSPGGFGAVRITSDRPVVAQARVWSDGGVGQAENALPVSASVPAGGASDVTGLASGDGWRTNLIAVDTSGVGTEARITVTDAGGHTVGSLDIELQPWEPYLMALHSIVGDGGLAAGTAHVEVLSGAAVFAASRVSAAGDDALTLEQWWNADAAAGRVAGTWFGAVEADDGGLGGIRLTVSPDGIVTAVDFSVPAASEVCDETLRGGGELEEPVLLTGLADGISFFNLYGGDAEITWSLRLAPVPGSPHLTGELVAEAAGFQGELSGCNGLHPAARLDLGRAAD